MSANSRVMLIAAAAMAALGLWLLAGCIKNDIPYPRIQPNFTEFEAEGLLSAAEIDSASRVVTLKLAETTDIYAVDVTSYKLSAGASLVAGELDAPLNLTEPYVVTLRMYQDYDWVIVGRQEIERYFTVEGQVGATIIDTTARRVVVTVPANPGAKAVKVLSQKLGPQGCVETPDMTGQTINLVDPVKVTVEAWGRTEEWEIFCRTTQSTVSTTRVDAWTQVAWVYGAAMEGRDNGVEYREVGSEKWTKAPAEWVTHTGATFCARLVHLNPQTEYEARAYSDDEKGEIKTFTTQELFQMPNESFSDWWLDGKVWQPWKEGSEPYWGTGNKGSAFGKESNVTPSDITSSGTGKAARLESLDVFTKLAAGSIFAGSFVKIDGTNGILSFGRPCDLHPTKLRGYLKYSSKPITNLNDAVPFVKAGENDTCIVWCALVDCAEPITIRTKPSERHLFDKNASFVIAYGEVQYGEDVTDYIPFEINLDYRSTSRIPKYILTVASSSKYGDYFVGGVGSTLYVDDFELVYDY